MVRFGPATAITTRKGKHVMNDRIRHIMEQITALENDLQIALREQQQRLLYEIRGRRVRFENSIHVAHLRLKTGWIQWMLDVRPRDLLTAPIIYGMAVPLLLFDACITFYQLTCFPMYGIRKVKRADYIAYDHQFLAYLNIFEKAHCLYCSYANGMVGYAREIIARTEQYFCPIKHARRMLDPHERYVRFLDYGDAENFSAELDRIRVALRQEK
jgi:hypothetical protein